MLTVNTRHKIVCIIAISTYTGKLNFTGNDSYCEVPFLAMQLANSNFNSF